MRSGARWSEAAARIGLVALFAALTLLGLEGALRVYHRAQRALETSRLPETGERALIPSDDPELVYVFNPGFQRGGFRVNSLGMAGRETTREKPAGAFRIAFVGDSISAGFGQLERDDLYLNVAEGLLAAGAPGTRVESLNFGVNGYGILQGLRMAQRVVPDFEPDLVVAQICLNDPYPSPTSYVRTAPQDPIRLRAFLLRRLRPARHYARHYVDRRYDEQGWANLRRGFEGLAQLARGGPPVVALLFPYLYRPAYSDWGFEALHRGIAEIARESGLPLLDLLPDYRRAGLIADDWPRDPIHPEAPGHRVAAERLVESLRAWQLLQGRGESRPAITPAASGRSATTKSGPASPLAATSAP